MAAAAILAVCVPKCGWTGQAELMRVIVTRIGPDGTWGLWIVDTAGVRRRRPVAGTHRPRALAVPPPCRPVPAGLVCHLRVGDQAVLIAGRDLSGLRQNLVTAVITRTVRRAPCPRRAAQQITVEMIQDELPAPGTIQYDALVVNRLELRL
jgi:hypothetical protein